MHFSPTVVYLNYVHTLTAEDSLFINCGGPGLEFEGNHYEEDTQIGGPAAFFSSAEKWGFSSTGVFTGDEGASFIAQGETQNQTKSEIYQTARLSPLSLKYYGLCMRKGSYKVQLHFSEILFSNGPTFRNLGRRVFNVSIQVSKSILDLFIRYSLAFQEVKHVSNFLTGL